MYPNKPFALPDQLNVDKKFKKSFYESDLVKIVYLLDELNKDKYTKHILRYLATTNIPQGREILAAELATTISRYDFAIQQAHLASYETRIHTQCNTHYITQQH